LLFFLVRSARYSWSIPFLWAATVFLGKHNGWLERHGIPDLIVYVPCFLSGVIAYKLTRTWRLRLPAWLWPPTLVMLSVLYLKQPSYQTAWYCCLMLGIAIPQFQEMTNRISRKIFQTIARYSYGIYLTHLICIWVAFQAMSKIPGWSRWLILLITVFVFPYLLYQLIEKPMIRCGERIANALRNWLEAPVFPGSQVENAVE
jgi:peptidoglycan/LPS O-acetylase OafA/YrhL